MRVNRLVFVTATALLLGAQAPVAAEEAVQERYSAVAMNLSAGPGPQQTRMSILIRGWSSDEQRTALLTTLERQGSAALVQALREEPEVGTISFTGTTGFPLRYSRSFQEGEVRHVVLATDRPVGNVEVLRHQDSLDKSITIVHLSLDAEGKGVGTLLLGTELSLEPATRELTVEHLGTQPIQLHHVEKQ